MSVRGSRLDARDESGETLMELLITMILMGVAVVGILAGLIAVTRLADHNAKTTHVGNTAQSYAEELKQPVDAALAGFSYEDCALVTDYPDFAGTLPNASFGASITNIEYLSALPSAANGRRAQWSTSCTTDLGLQRITVLAEVDNGASNEKETVTIVKRNASCPYALTAQQNADQGPC